MLRLREQFGIGEVTAHSLRRTIAKWAGEQRDIRPEAIEALLNHQPHSDDVTRWHYNQVRLTDEVRDILERWAEHVAGVVVWQGDEGQRGAVGEDVMSEERRSGVSGST